MCKLCKTFDFRKVFIEYEPDTAYVAISCGRLQVTPEDERFRFCPLCGRELTEVDFQRKDAE